MELEGCVIRGCTALEKIVFPSSLTYIPNGTFVNVSMDLYIIDDRMEAIWKDTFWSSYIKSVVIPISVTSVANGVFEDMTGNVFFEHGSEPVEWGAIWSLSTNIYWAGEWHYDTDGNPQPNK